MEVQSLSSAVSPRLCLESSVKSTQKNGTQQATLSFLNSKPAIHYPASPQGLAAQVLQQHHPSCSPTVVVVGGLSTDAGHGHEGARRGTPGALLLKERIVFLGNHRVDDFVADATISQLLLRDAQDPTKDIRPFINCPALVALSACEGRCFHSCPGDFSINSFHNSWRWHKGQALCNAKYPNDDSSTSGRCKWASNRR